MTRRTYFAKDLSEVVLALKDISRRRNNDNSPLWFRGHSMSQYQLLPSLFRQSYNYATNGVNDERAYNACNLEEQYRLQNYKARVFHLTSPTPESPSEWQALYQHYLGKTRMLDWTESIWIAMAFSLEAFLDGRSREDLRQQRIKSAPTIWVLDPYILNEKVYEHITKYGVKKEYYKNALMSFNSCDELLKRFEARMKKKTPYFKKGAILNIGTIDEIRRSNMYNMENKLSNGEFNPFFYLCVRYYSDGIPVAIMNNDELLPPLAVLHPYQNERIRTQRGTFTIFPNYDITKIKNVNSDYQQDIRAMDKQDLIRECLYRINITNPQILASELYVSGIRQTDLYPENEYYARRIEAEL